MTIFASVENIEEQAFSGCDWLQDITVDSENTSFSFMDGVLYITDQTRLLAYLAAKINTAFSIPASVTSIDRYAFYGCKYLLKATIPESITVINDNAFTCCYSLTNITLSDTVTEIGEQAFAGCSELKSIVLPKNVESVGKYAFSMCSSLTSVKVKNTNARLGSDLFSGIDTNSLGLLGYEGSTTEAYADSCDIRFGTLVKSS